MTRPLTVMTGATSGFGRHTAHALIAAGDRLVATTRGAPGPEGAEMVMLDLADLSAVRRAAEEIGTRAAGQPIARLLLNAGGNLRMDPTVDGYEANFAVNHLAHYLLLRLLLPRLAPGAVVILTTSGTHDPAEGTPIPPPRHADAMRLAHPDTDPERDASVGKATGRAYAAAKLANLMTARALADRPEGRGLRVIAYAPGPVPGTGLVSGRGGLTGVIWRRCGPLLRLLPGTHSPELAGETLARLALGDATPPEGRVYALLEGGRLTFPDPSVLARDDDATRKMWEDSARLTGWTDP
ncbi:putative dehydrogenase/reductase [Primorskyibacter flagellatus]|uniref:Dehydrogenase/reductase n=1 Tax=Primorskyibacter flagellatus TaxID=1387277 RepID=A0A917AD70_9RHOB|nr:SDR family NAD(P)-dependent oxidoreductase [Primorskyibacter flagellatus]GGE39789.1 putative dehydrogenase/reductase [Primorskyibacter flagellatus]